MFKVIIKETNEEIQCLNKKIKFTKNQALILTFELAINSNKYNKLKKYLDYVQVVNERDDSLIFNGRVISSQTGMSNIGEFNNTITCESIINYFNDTYVGKWEFHPLDLPDKAPKGAISNATIKMFLSKVLDNHNSKVEVEKQIYLGNIEFDDRVYIKTNYESSLSTIMSKIVDRHEGYLIIRNDNGLNYLDFLSKSPIKEVQKIEIGTNLDSINVDDSDTDIFTTIIPLGKNNVGIESVNNGCDYIQNDILVKKYGVIEKVMEWKDITIPQNLLNKAKSAFSKVKLDADNVNLTALDLSYINNSFECLKLYRPIRAINKAIDYDNTHEIVSINLDLDYPFKSTFDLNTTLKTSNDNVSSAIEQTNSNKIEIVSIGDELETKVSDDSFESYKIQNSNEIKDTVSSINKDISSVIEQTSSEIKDTVKDINNNIEATRKILAGEIEDKVSSKDFNSYKVQTNKVIEQSVTDSKNYADSSITETADNITSVMNKKIITINDNATKNQKDTTQKIEALNSKIEQSAKVLTSTFTDNITIITKDVNSNSNAITTQAEILNSKIEQSAKSISSEVDSKMSIAKQNVTKVIKDNVSGLNDVISTNTSQIKEAFSKISETADDISAEVDSKISTKSEEIIKNLNNSITNANATVENNLTKDIDGKISGVNNNISGLKNITTINTSQIKEAFSKINETSDSINLEVNSKITIAKQEVYKTFDSNIDSISGKLNDTNNSIVGLSGDVNNLNRAMDINTIQIKEAFSKISETSDNITSEVDSKITIAKQQIGSVTDGIIANTNKSINNLNDGIYKNMKTLNENITNNSSRITQAANAIKLKVTKDEVSSEFTEKMNNFNFKIGDNTPLSITQDALDMKFSDGSECEIGKDGFYYVTGDKKFAYHSLYYHDSITKVPSGVTKSITIPEVFRGKDYKIAYWLGNVFPADGDSSSCLHSYDVVKTNDSHNNLTFDITVNIRYCSYGQAYELKGYGNIVYTILA